MFVLAITHFSLCVSVSVYVHCVNAVRAYSIYVSGYMHAVQNTGVKKEREPARKPMDALSLLTRAQRHTLQYICNIEKFTN